MGAKQRTRTVEFKRDGEQCSVSLWQKSEGWSTTIGDCRFQFAPYHGGPWGRGWRGRTLKGKVTVTTDQPTLYNCCVWAWGVAHTKRDA